MDGSSKEFLDVLGKTHLVNQSKKRKYLKVSNKIFIISPSPAPSSTKLIFSGLLKFSQNDINQMDIISEKRTEILGDVMKSPFFPKGFFLI